MSVSDEIRKLRELRDSGVLTEEEFARAKARALSSPAHEAEQTDGAALQRDVQRLRVENDLIRLEREWEMERETYLITGKYGSRHVPTKSGALFSAVLGGGLGVFWTLLAMARGAVADTGYLAICFILLGVGFGLFEFNKAGAYDQALQRYEERRAALLARADPEQRRSRAVDPTKSGK